MDICNTKIINGIIIRYITTFIAFYFLSTNIGNILNKGKYIYLILPILLTLLDNVDNLFTIFYKNNICTKTYYYQYNDKICDSISYLSLFLFFNIDKTTLIFILYRLIGVILFYVTMNKKWLIIFFDFVKEYLIYLFFFGNNYLYLLPILMLSKICFEYYYHMIHNGN